MQKLSSCITVCALLVAGINLHGQDIRFNHILKSSGGAIIDIQQDKQGILWIADFNMGLQRYDGINLKSYKSDQRNPGTGATGGAVSVAVDADNIIWVGTLSGLQRFDPSTNTFTLYRFNQNDSLGLSSDTVTSILEDHLGNLWVGTSRGLDLLDRKTGKFKHYRNKPNDPSSLSSSGVFKLFEDKKGVLWVGCFDFGKDTKLLINGLNRFDRATGKFTSYLFEPASEKKFRNAIVDLYEDRNGRFWILTALPGLYMMDKKAESFRRYYPDPMNPGALSEQPVAEKLINRMDFIMEDVRGGLWIGLSSAGLIRYDSTYLNSTHFGRIYDGDKLLSTKDTASGFTARDPTKAISSKDGLFWVATSNGNLFNANYNRTIIPFYEIPKQSYGGANSFYCEPNGNILWVASNNGLIRRDLKNQSDRVWLNNPKDENSISHNSLSAMRVDEEGKFWLGTNGSGLDKFDPSTGKFLHYKNDPKKPGSISGNNFSFLFIDRNKNLWAASDSGISRMDKRTEQFINYRHDYKDSTSLPAENVLCIAEDNDGYIWLASEKGMIRLNVTTGKFRSYITSNFIKSICVDSKGTIWAGGREALHYYDKAKDEFVLFGDEQSPVAFGNIINVIEDDQKNLWVSTGNAIIKISEDKARIKKYTHANGVRASSFFFNDNYKAKDGKLYLGIEYGYYAFYPNQLSDASSPPQLSISGFKLVDKEIKPEPNGILTAPLWKTTELRLSHNQNVFSFDFFAVDYISPGDANYQFMLENYDDTWHDIGSDHRAFFFNVPPGKYNFRVKAISADGATAEKNIRIIIDPPWWRKWWAYCLYAVLLLLAGYLIYKYQKYYIVKRERQRMQQKELAQAKEIEKAYTELKATQVQLIQSEKMASLGELTAGIAHEIQNPLNFVNNFSEINIELVQEMKEALEKGDSVEAQQIAATIEENENKIIFHGKRADSIVKGMLQHSRNSTGIKEPTDINKLADEYLRLAYHGLRAKDKSFNATLKTSYDQSIGNIFVAPQDLGRVILNLITNAFYAVTEKARNNPGNYEPTVTVDTKKNGETVVIKVKDNGNGIPTKVIEKIFQPFFTTKPAGQGTGLGLSLSYDIIRAHGGELRVETKEGEGSEFIIQLPAMYN